MSVLLSDKLEEIKEENYPNKRRFNAAYTLANEFLCYSDKEVERRDKACCQFIIDNADKITGGKLPSPTKVVSSMHRQSRTISNFLSPSRMRTNTESTNCLRHSAKLRNEILCFRLKFGNGF